MKIIKVSTIKIEVDDKTIMHMMECVTMESKQQILIRNKRDAFKLSKMTRASLEESRRQRFRQAIEDDDTLYLNSIYENFSMMDLLKILNLKIRNHN